MLYFLALASLLATFYSFRDSVRYSRHVSKTKETPKNRPWTKEVVGHLAALNLWRIRQILGISLAEANRNTSLSAEMLSRVEQRTRSLEAGELIDLAAFYDVPVETIVKPWSWDDLPDGITATDLPYLKSKPFSLQPPIQIGYEFALLPIKQLRKNARDSVFSSDEGLRALSKSPTPETLNLLIERELINQLNEKIDASYNYTARFTPVLDHYYDAEDLEGKYFYVTAWRTHSHSIRSAIEAYLNAASTYALPKFLTDLLKCLDRDLTRNDEWFSDELASMRKDPDFKDLTLNNEGNLSDWKHPMNYLTTDGYYGRPYPNRAKNNKTPNE